jgi:transposase InsO family protein
LDLFLKREIEAFSVFKKFTVLVENLSSERIKVLKSDRSGEFTSKEFINFCEEKGVRRFLTVPYSPQ